MASRTAAEPGSTAPGSLTEWLRSRSDEQLAVLLRRRPDLALPAPADLAQLASRLSVRTSVQRAVDALDAFTLRVLEVLVLTSTDHAAVVEAATQLLTPVPAEDVQRALAELEALGLIWGLPDAAHLVATVAESLGSYPAGLGRPAAALFALVSDVQLAPVLRTLGLAPATQPRAGATVAAELADPLRLRRLIDACDDTERDVLDRLAAGPPIGTVRDAHLAAGASLGPELTPPHRLLARGLLAAVDAQTVELPREVGLALRGDRPLGEVSSDPPEIAVVTRTPAELDAIGGTAVYEALRLVSTLGEAWTAGAPAMLRTGGVGVRELRRTARDLDVDEPAAAALIEVAAAAGLIAPTTGIEPVYLPTAEFDGWVRQSPAHRWAELATAWLGMSRQPGLVGHRGDRDRVITVLGPDAERGTVAAQRATVLDVLRELPPGTAPRERADVLARLAWLAPRRAAAQRQAIEAILAEADLIGLTAAGGLTGYARTLLAGSRAAAEQALAGALPEPVDHFLVQPDLTVVVPGPPQPALAIDLALVADLESSGGARVYRVTDASVRRALDAGRTAAELSALFAQRSRTPVPQALQYLIDDVARRHGVLRAGTASAYLRCEDDALLARVLSDRAVATLGLRRIAPTVVVSTTPVPRVLEVLRGAGYAPAAEGPDGAVITLGAEPPRAPSRSPVRVIRPRQALGDGAQVSELIRRIRSGDTITELSRQVRPVVQQVPGVTSATTMALLRQAIREGRRVLLGSAEPDGTSTRHTILPISLAAGFVRGHDSESQSLRSFPLHRLTAVSILADELDDDADRSIDHGDEPA